jgi:hypothetical protein
VISAFSELISIYVIPMFGMLALGPLLLFTEKLAKTLRFILNLNMNFRDYLKMEPMHLTMYVIYWHVTVLLDLKTLHYSSLR